jgi:cytochrome b561
LIIIRQLQQQTNLTAGEVMDVRMSLQRAPDRYSQPAIFFHWAIFLLVALAYLAIEVRGPKGTESRAFWTSVHFWAGTLVLTLAVARLVWRLWTPAPVAIDVNRLLAFLARAAHLALYLFIFAQPLLGMLMVNTGGHPVTLAGLNLNFTLVGAAAAQNGTRVDRQCVLLGDRRACAGRDRPSRAAEGSHVAAHDLTWRAPRHSARREHSHRLDETGCLIAPVRLVEAHITAAQNQTLRAGFRQQAARRRFDPGAVLRESAHHVFEARRGCTIVVFERLGGDHAFHPFTVDHCRERQGKFAPRIFRGFVRENDLHGIRLG